MPKKKKVQKGITLISLVITIIVLLIIATVAISIAVDSNGLFARARKAAEDWNTSVSDEEKAVENVFEILNEVNVGGTVGGGELQPPVSDNLPEGWSKENVADVVEDKESDRKAPIPKGYVVSDVEGENSINDGLVIYEGEGTVDENNHEDAMKKRNQYVWIPVDDINDMVMCQICGASVQLDTTTLQCPTCTTSTKLAGKLYATSNTFESEKNGQKYYSTAGFREPAIVTGKRISI